MGLVRLKTGVISNGDSAHRVCPIEYRMTPHYHDRDYHDYVAIDSVYALKNQNSMYQQRSYSYF